METPATPPDEVAADVTLAAHPSPSFRAELLATLPGLRAFARGMCGNRDLGDDLVQDAIVKAWSAHHSFVKDSNFRAWIFRILRNQYYNYRSREARLTPWEAGNPDHDIAVPANQEVGVVATDLQRSLLALSPEHREIVVLAAADMNYEAIADIVGCPVGTVKSRLWRARRILRETLELTESPANLARTAHVGRP